MKKEKINGQKKQLRYHIDGQMKNIIYNLTTDCCKHYLQALHSNYTKNG